MTPNDIKMPLFQTRTQINCRVNIGYLSDILVQRNIRNRRLVSIPFDRRKIVGKNKIPVALRIHLYLNP